MNPKIKLNMLRKLLVRKVRPMLRNLLVRKLVLRKVLVRRMMTVIVTAVHEVKVNLLIQVIAVRTKMNDDNFLNYHH